VPEVEAVLRLAQADATTVSVDLHEVSFMDSSGIGMLVRAQRRAKTHNNEIVVLRPSATVQGLLAMCGMDRALIAQRSPDIANDPGRPHALIATDLDGIVTHWNRDAQTLYGYAAEDVLGRPITNVTVAPLHDRDAHKIMETIRTQGRWQGPFEVVRVDGSTFRAWVRDILVIDNEERPRGVLGLSVPLLVPAPMNGRVT
jgi:anti-anti-sigma factor